MNYLEDKNVKNTKRKAAALTTVVFLAIFGAIAYQALESKSFFSKEDTSESIADTQIKTDKKNRRLP